MKAKNKRTAKKAKTLKVVPTLNDYKLLIAKACKMKTASEIKKLEADFFKHFEDILLVNLVDSDQETKAVMSWIQLMEKRCQKLKDPDAAFALSLLSQLIFAT